MIEELVGRGFAIRDAAHLAHWASKSYSEHQALGAFYDAVPEKLDGIVEAYQGWFDLIGDVTKKSLPTGSIIEAIAKEGAWVASNRDKIAKGCTMVENLLDDYTQLFSQTYYMLKNLK